MEDSGDGVYDDAGVIGALLLPSEGVEAGGAPSPETPGNSAAHDQFLTLRALNNDRISSMQLLLAYVIDRT